MDIHDPKKVKQLIDKIKELYEQRTLLERGLQDIKKDIISYSAELIRIREQEKKEHDCTFCAHLAYCVCDD